MPFIPAAIAGIGSLVGGAAAGAAGLAGAAASAVGGLAGMGASAIGGIGSGIGSLFAPAAMTVGQQMAEQAAPAFYETAGPGILGGVTSAVSGTADYLGNLLPSAMGIYQMFKPPEAISPAPAVRYMPSVPAPGIGPPALPVLAAQPPVQPPVILTAGAPAGPETNYTLYIAIAILAFILLRKK